MGVLEQALAVAMSYHPLSAADRQQLLARTAAAGASGKYELYQTSDRFDGTSHHPYWLDTARE